MWEAGLDDWGQNVQGKPTEEVFKKGCIHFPHCCGKFLVKDGGKEELILATVLGTGMMERPWTQDTEAARHVTSTVRWHGLLSVILASERLQWA